MQKFHRQFPGILFGAMAMLLVSGTAAGEPQGSTQGGAWGQQQRVDPMAELQHIEKRLFEIEKQTLDANPELKQQLDDLESMARDAMIDSGYNPDADIETLRSARTILRDESLSDDVREKAFKDARDAQKELRDAEYKVMHDEEVAKAHSIYRTDLFAAMREEAPELDQLVKRYQQIQGGL